MKKIKYLSLILLTGIIYAFSSIGGDPITTLELGASAPLPDQKMKDVSGETYAIKDAMKENGVLVVFSCNTCPFVIGNGADEGWEGRYNDVNYAANKAGVGMMLINSNEAKRDQGDSFEDMVARAADKAFEMHYVIDENNVMADAFGARTTPHVFLFDKELKLVYKGAIDDNNKSSARVTERWLENALNKLAKNEAIDPASTRNIGCSIKRIKS